MKTGAMSWGPRCPPTPSWGSICYFYFHCLSSSETLVNKTGPRLTNAAHLVPSSTHPLLGGGCCPSTLPTHTPTCQGQVSSHLHVSDLGPPVAPSTPGLEFPLHLLSCLFWGVLCPLMPGSFPEASSLGTCQILRRFCRANKAGSGPAECPEGLWAQDLQTPPVRMGAAGTHMGSSAMLYLPVCLSCPHSDLGACPSIPRSLGSPQGKDPRLLPASAAHSSQGPEAHLPDHSILGADVGASPDAVGVTSGSQEARLQPAAGRGSTPVWSWFCLLRVRSFGQIVYFCVSMALTNAKGGSSQQVSEWGWGWWLVGGCPDPNSLWA